MGKLSIRVRLALAHTVAFAILLGFWSAALYRMAATRAYSQVDAQLEERYAGLRPFLNVSQSQVTWLFDKKAVEQSSYLIAHAVFDEQGKNLEGSVLASVFALPFTDTARQAIQSRGATWETVAESDQHKVRILNSTITGSDGQVYLLRVGMLLDQTEDDLRQLAGLLAFFVPMVVAIGGLTGWWIAGSALQPVAEITQTAQRISASNLAARLPLRGSGDELDRLTATLNEMITRLEQSFEQMSHFLSNVSHELRTPVAALRGSCEIALRNAKSEKECRAVLASNIEELDRLAKTVSDLLALARAEAGQIPLDRKLHNLAELVRDAVESARVLAAERGISIGCKTDGSVAAEVDMEHLLRLLINLLDNAIKYNRPNGRIDVELSATDGWALVTVADTGQGIAPEDLPHIFDRFYRGQIEGEGSVGGTGLGLSLARWVATAHGGRIEVESQQGQGSSFRLWLPRTERSDQGEIARHAPLRTDLVETPLRDKNQESLLDRSQFPVQQVQLVERRTAMHEHIVRGAIGWGWRVLPSRSCGGVCWPWGCRTASITAWIRRLATWGF